MPKKNIMDQEITTRKEFINGYRNTAAGERGAGILDKKRVFPLTYRNPRLSFLNCLGLYTYFSGSVNIIRETKKDQYNGFLHLPGKEREAVVSGFNSALGLGLNPRGKGFQFGRNGNVCARLLECAGFFMSERNEGDGKARQTKARVGSSLPP